MSPKIIQILFAPQDSTWQGVLLGLADDGAVYALGGASAKWEPLIPPIGATPTPDDTDKGATS